MLFNVIYASDIKGFVVALDQHYGILGTVRDQLIRKVQALRPNQANKAYICSLIYAFNK